MACMACLNDLAVGEAQGQITETQQNFTTICELAVATVGDKVFVTGKDGPDEGEIIDGCDYIKIDGNVVAIDGSEWISPKYRGNIRVVNRCCVTCCEGSGGAPFSFQLPISLGGRIGGRGRPGSPNVPNLSREQIKEISDNTGIPESKIEEIVNPPRISDDCGEANNLNSKKDDDCDPTDKL